MCGQRTKAAVCKHFESLKEVKKSIEWEPFSISMPWWFRWCQSDIKFELALVVSSLERLQAFIVVVNITNIHDHCEGLQPLNWHYGNMCGQRTKPAVGKHFESLKMTKAMWVFDFLWLCSLLEETTFRLNMAGRKSPRCWAITFGACRTWWTSFEWWWNVMTFLQVTRVVVDLNRYGYPWIEILARKVPESWVSRWPNSSISPV